ncbi:uncharacterized protein LOC128894808 [Hylaeus anthracinus]|uniref:uncharacterized protein LOC128894808 n=1 Tax=Hylaeus anthracinus TaxID=313031 RepID=UPI0023B926A6|nr:uncharacterized protein LOC128894808 [Hylaeus anthracinus]XP_054012781.1 uncharacterized protein LOC128894808 [Hylaeus anthracinus]XP_054012782.1 uncharacterized protein LOC128894808 [Hylaeus anthracinus]XP_054012783.1 uncharacterized protein LOC128894808 [Hylaeus anthracinus]
MTPSLCTCTWLLLPCCILVTLSTGELKFYRDEVPENSENVALRQLMKYLEQGDRFRLSPFLANQAHKKHQLQLDRQKKRDLLEALTDKANLADILWREKLKGWRYRQTRYDEPIDETPPRERERYLPLYGLNRFDDPVEYPGFKLPSLPRETNSEDANYQDFGYEYGRNVPFKHPSYEGRANVDKGTKKEPLFQLRVNYGGSLDGINKKMQNPLPTVPEFTFEIDDSNLNDKHPFAVKPNDPRFYQDAPFSSSNDDNSDLEKTAKNETNWGQGGVIIEKVHTMDEDNVRNAESKIKDASVIMIPELERRTGYNPLVIPVNHNLNNDIYFIAIVAGCSAAAMFALVLITLTWCRLKRGAKAAADIEYPAYGVTGPNKEVSPSGDQRLAQSAQMYHFQHQKQQIIAMENRVSASRDPGSVSEAESEEENEEGDYTVYECPGLASTGEMEVKNPLFHDDPTPATPAQTNKEEDHI